MIAIAVVVVSSAALFALDESVKERLIEADAIVFDGALRRVYHHQRLPVLPATVPAPKPNAYAWLEHDGARIIKHAMGRTPMFSRNSVGAFENSIAAGYTIIEGDLRLTTDGDLVCFHGEDAKPISTKSYLKAIEKGQQAPCYFSDIANLLRAHPEVYFVVDAKDDFVATYSSILKIAPDIVRQLIPQLYDFEQIVWVRQHHFSGALFTSYLSALTTEQMFFYAKETHIEAVTLTEERALKLASVPSNISVFTHTIDDPIEAGRFLQRGFKGVYSNELPPT
ncbi:glycerophosphodiester phosphodiesterase family protein [Thalassospira lohafexi]|uniref:GP-PDE domain-containing protein n=1 Tax=Thalassospira lohafexi TaxID=744227 RepID=A0A2N3L6S0_9PROT|nr:glycerophosphodiester phosphodiesterase family protein [Thalassospira lohafexi]PKR58524.1 hypothetical protein COO92_12420 [Thalassospira lohafexi]